MPIYKVGNTKKDGLQKYNVRINYVADNGQKRQIIRSVYGIDVAKNLEKQLENEIKVQQEIPIKKITVQQLYYELSVRHSITQKFKNKSDVETPPKNKSSIRTLQIPLPLIEILKEHKKRQMQLPNFSEDSRVLGDGKCLRDTALQQKNILYSKLAKVKTIRIHDFRHSHVSLLANMGINIQEVARRLGHKKVEITWDIYSHLYPKEEEKAVAILNAV